MAWFSTKQVRLAAAQASAVSVERMIREQAIAALDRIVVVAEPPPTLTAPSAVFDIFPSHSALDEILVLGIYSLLQHRGYKVCFELYPTVEDNPSRSSPHDMTIRDGPAALGTWYTWLALPKSY